MFWHRKAARRQPLIHWLIDGLGISKAPDASEWRQVYEAGVRCVVDLRAEAQTDPALVDASGLRQLRLPVVEGAAPTADELRLVTDWIVGRMETDGPVLVHCREGRGRSALIACAALIKLGLPLAEAYRLLRLAREDVALSDEQERALIAFALAQGKPERV